MCWMRTGMLYGIAVAAIVSAACDAQPPAEREPRGLDLAGATVVDLSHPYDDATLYWPTAATRFELSELAHGMTDGGYFYAANAFCTPEHGGTHIDAPIHFAEQGWSLGDVPVERLIAPGVVIDVSAAAAQDPDYRLTAADVLAWEQAYGEIPGGAIVLLRTGWSSRWPVARTTWATTPPATPRTSTFRRTAPRPPACSSSNAASRPWGSTPRASTTGRRPISACTGLPPPPTSPDWRT